MAGQCNYNVFFLFIFSWGQNAIHYLIAIYTYRLVRLHTNVNNSLERLQKFIFTEWKFNNAKTLLIHESLSTADQKTFTLDIRSLSWRDYFVNLTLGVRTYLSNESPKSLGQARRKDKMWVVIDILKFVYFEQNINCHLNCFQLNGCSFGLASGTSWISVVDGESTVGHNVD